MGHKIRNRTAMLMKKIRENVFEIPQDIRVVRIGSEIKKFEMRVPAHIYANDSLLELMKRDKTLDQLANMACLPGIQKHAIALSDAHQGYGYCIGGVAATDREEGAISPGGVGYDVNCGVRLLRTNLDFKDVNNLMPRIMDHIFNIIPSGLGSKGKITINYSQLDDILEQGVHWAVENGYGWKEDTELCEESGCIKGAVANKVTKKAKDRGIHEVGSLGSGNHFLEVQRVQEIYDEHIAKVLGITHPNQITVMVHTGSRALGHQTCTDYLQIVEHANRDKYHIELPDRELVCVLGKYPEAQEYLKAMAAAANFGFANRQIITHWVREAFSKAMGKAPEELDLGQIFDVAHNILKIEEHTIDHVKKTLNVHRKGATRAFPPEHPSIPQKYQSIGQPVLIPGSMGTASYLCVGQPAAMELSFGSTAHGSGREMSRTKASNMYRGKEIQQALNQQGISVKAASFAVLAEEAPGAYKDIDQVVQVSHDLGIIKKIVRLVPVGVTKG